MDAMETKIKKILNEALIKRLLTKYFLDKEIPKENFDRNIYPPMIGDLIERLPQFQGKIEIVPYVEDINPYTGQVKVEWNLFVLGSQRMDLGRSSHKNTAEIQEAIMGQQTRGQGAVPKASPDRIIEFIVKVLGDNEAGMIDPSVEANGNGVVGALQNRGQMKPGASAKFYAGSQGFERNKPVL